MSIENSKRKGQSFLLLLWRSCQHIVAEVSLTGCHGGWSAGFDWIGGDRRGLQILSWPITDQCQAH